MRIDMKRQAEVNQRQGLTWRTALAVVWFVLCLVFAYFFTGWLIDSGTLDNGLVYGALHVPPTVSMPVVRLVTMFLIVGGLQFVAIIGFAMTTPTARARTGRPTAVAQSVDCYEQRYNRRA